MRITLSICYVQIIVVTSLILCGTSVIGVAAILLSLAIYMCENLKYGGGA